MFLSYGLATLPCYILDELSLVCLSANMYEIDLIYDAVFNPNERQRNAIVSIKALPFRAGIKYTGSDIRHNYNDLVYTVNDKILYKGTAKIEEIPLSAVFNGVRHQGYALAIKQVRNQPTFKYRFTRQSLNILLTNQYIDYSSLSDYNLYLPFLGYYPIDYNLIKTSAYIDIEYWLDYYSCNISCNVICNIGGVDIRVIETFANIGYDISIGYNDNAEITKSLLEFAGKVAGTALTGSMPSSFSALTASKTVNRTVNDITKKRNTKTKRPYVAKNRQMSDITTTTGEETTTYYGNTQRQLIFESFEGINNLINSGSDDKLYYQSNNMIAANSLNTPFIKYRHPIMNVYDGFLSHYGRLKNRNMKLSEIKGYTVISSIHLKIPCLNEELQEIETLLTSGVIINNVLEPSPEPQPTPTPTPTPTPPIPEPVEPPPPLPEGEVATMLCCFNGKFKVTQTMHSQHPALDLVGLDSQIVYAISDGYIENKYQEGGAGYYVRQHLDNGNFIYYMHLQKDSFKSGNKQYICAGAPLGIMGNTGNSFGAHTHLELREDNATTPLDICAFTGIPNKEGEYIGSPTYKNPETAALQSAVGLENQTMNYIDNYTYSKDLSSKILEKINNK